MRRRQHSAPCGSRYISRARTTDLDPITPSSVIDSRLGVNLRGVCRRKPESEISLERRYPAVCLCWELRGCVWGLGTTELLCSESPLQPHLRADFARGPGGCKRVRDCQAAW